MSQKTHIAWTDSTWNPWMGCSKVSAGCKHCYAETLVNGRMGLDFAQRIRTKPGTFDAPLAWNKKPIICDNCGTARRLSETECEQCFLPDQQTGFKSPDHHRRRVFALSLGDWLDLKVPVEWLADMLDIVRRCEGLDFQLLTKRPGHFFQRFTDAMRYNENTMGSAELHAWLLDWASGFTVPANVWIGTSVEDQANADRRIPELLKIPARIRFLSVEPLLEPVRLALDNRAGPKLGHMAFIDWVIVGGESGPDRRDCGTTALDLVQIQCADANVPCFVKQDCALAPGLQGRLSAAVWNTKQFPV